KRLRVTSPTLTVAYGDPFNLTPTITGLDQPLLGVTCPTNPATPPFNVGNYTVNCTGPVSGSSAVDLVDYISGSLTITKARPTVTATGNTCTYNGTGCAGSGTATGKQTPPENLAPVTLSYVGTGNTAYGPSQNAPVNAGSYAVTATYGDNNYETTTS